MSKNLSPAKGNIVQVYREHQNMQTLIIGNEALRTAYEAENGAASEVTWVDGLEGAFSTMDVEDIDRIVFDIRTCQSDPCPELKKLIARTPVTTRVMAIVDQLPEGQLCVESGVVYLTPPIQLRDINWFLRRAEDDAE